VITGRSKQASIPRKKYPFIKEQRQGVCGTSFQFYQESALLFSFEGKKNKRVNDPPRKSTWSPVLASRLFNGSFFFKSKHFYKLLASKIIL